MKTKFTWREWLLTGADENLLELDDVEAELFRLIVREGLT